MNMLLKSLAAVLVIAYFGLSACEAQTKVQTLTFKVWGNCEMCQETIEKSLDVKGIKSANWNKDTKMLTVVFNNEKIQEGKIHELVAASGYDTEKLKGSDAAYGKLPDCCQYTRKK